MVTYIHLHWSEKPGHLTYLHVIRETNYGQHMDPLARWKADPDSLDLICMIKVTRSMR